jgi:hypothetical protein
MAKQSIDVLGLTPGQDYRISVYAVTTESDGKQYTSQYSTPLTISTPAVSTNGSNFSLSNNGTDIQLKGGSLYAGTFPTGSGQIDVVNDTPDATGVVLNQSGLAGFNNGAKQFYISAVNGDAWFAGTVSAGAIIAGTPASNLVTYATSGYLKISTFYQDEAPTASQTGDLWYDTNDGYKMYRWSGTTWQNVQDGAIVTAANAAAAAQTSADGKSRIIYGSAGSTSTKGYAPNGSEYEVTQTAPIIDTFSTSYTTTTGNKVGDTWFVRNNAGSIIAQYTVTSYTAPSTSVWTRTKVEGMVIGNLDAGKITVGTLSVGLGITTGTGLIELNASTGKLKATNAEITGVISASTVSSSTFTSPLYSGGNGISISTKSYSSSGITKYYDNFSMLVNSSTAFDISAYANGTIVSIAGAAITGLNGGGLSLYGTNGGLLVDAGGKASVTSSNSESSYLRNISYTYTAGAPSASTNYGEIVLVYTL